jgi:hypothetical protein
MQCEKPNGAPAFAGVTTFLEGSNLNKNGVMPAKAGIPFFSFFKPWQA